jgi:predicted Fe-Mo cluster-binding NifX family protein
MDGGAVRIAVAVDDQQGLECPCSSSAEAAAYWLIAELDGATIAGVSQATSPLTAEGIVNEAVDALCVDVLVCTAARQATCHHLRAHGVQVVTGASGSARRALLEFVTGALSAGDGGASLARS